VPRQAVLPELLEPRRLCDAEVDMKEGRITITVDAAPTTVNVYVTPDRKELRVEIDGALRDPKEGVGPTTGVKRDKVKKVLVFGGPSTDTITVTMSDDLSLEQQRKRFIAKVVVSGGGGDDVIVGGPQNDVLIGGPGNDTINGGDRNDLIFGGTGDDDLAGGLAKDNLFGQDGDDFLYGGPGDDALYGMPGNDELAGGTDADFFNGGPGNNTALDTNNEPGRGAADDVGTYMNRLVKLAVPDRFRDDVYT
jgi:Ca2+-binding RTX toxin-like protein